MANENTSLINIIEYDNEVKYDEDGDVIMEDCSEIVLENNDKPATTTVNESTDSLLIKPLTETNQNQIQNQTQNQNQNQTQTQTQNANTYKYYYDSYDDEYDDDEYDY